MALSDIINVTITSSSAQVEREGFGIPLLLAADTPGGFTERVRSYSNMTDVVADFASSTATYKMAARLFSQNPKLPLLKVGRLANQPTLFWKVTPAAVNSTAYTVTVNGVDYTYTSDGTATLTEVCTGLAAAITDVGVVAANQGNTYVSISAAAAGGWFGLEIKNQAHMVMLESHTSSSDGTNVAADLAAIALEDDNWYCIVSPFHGDVFGPAVVDYAEANQKLFVAQCADSAALVSSGSDTTSLAHYVSNAGDLRTAVIYTHTTMNMSDAAWAGACLSFDPGSETWAFKTLVGVAASQLTGTQRTNILAKNANCYTSVAGVSITEKGKVGGNEYIDVIRFRDWLIANIQADVFQALANAKKIPYTDRGIAVIQGLVQARLDKGVQAGGLSNNPAPLVTVPLAADVSDADKASRTLNNVKFDAVLAGAIQAVNITGTLSV